MKIKKKTSNEKVWKPLTCSVHALIQKVLLHCIDPLPRLKGSVLAPVSLRPHSEYPVCSKWPEPAPLMTIEQLYQISFKAKLAARSTFLKICDTQMYCDLRN